MLGSPLKVYLAPGATDLRKSINGLSVSDQGTASCQGA